VLNLNQKTLKEKRAIILKRLDKLLVGIINASGTSEDVINRFILLFIDYRTKQDGRFKPFYFVCMAHINEQGYNYIEHNC